MQKISYVLKKIVNKLCRVILFYIDTRVTNTWYVKLIYKCCTGEKLNISNPILFNEKIQWLKLNDHNPLYTELVDKIKVKHYVAKKLDETFITPTIGVWDRFEDIPIQELPNKFVMKCNHDSGSIVICKDKNTMNWDKVKKEITKSLKHNLFFDGREWAYRDVKPRILVEEYIETKGELRDYKVFCFHGVPKYIQVDIDRFTNHRRNIYTADWKYCNLSYLYPTDKNVVIQKPKVLKQMLDAAETLSEGLVFVRIDFYIINNCLRFGEMTFYPGGGMERFEPEEYNYYFGKELNLKLC